MINNPRQQLKLSEPKTKPGGATSKITRPHGRPQWCVRKKENGDGDEDENKQSKEYESDEDEDEEDERKRKEKEGKVKREVKGSCPGECMGYVGNERVRIFVPQLLESRAMDEEMMARGLL